MGLIDISKLTGMLKQVAEKAATLERNSEEIDSYKEVSLFKYLAEGNLASHDVQCDYTQDDINEIFGLAKPSHQHEANETDSEGYLIEDAWGQIHDQEADEAYKEGRLDRAAVTKAVEVALGEAIADGGAKLGTSIAAYDNAMLDIDRIQYKNGDPFAVSIDKYSQKAELADGLEFAASSVYNTLNKNEGILATNPRHSIALYQLEQNTFGTTAEEFYEQNKDDIDFIDDVMSAMLIDGTIKEEDRERFESLGELREKMATYKTAAQELAKEYEKLPSQIRNGYYEVAKSFEDGVAVIKENENAESGETQQPGGALDRYLAEAVHNVYRSEEYSGIESPEYSDNRPASVTKKVVGNQVIIEHEYKDGTVKRYDMQGRELQ